MSEAFHGLVLVNKPETWTSHDLVDFARKQFGTRSVGHCGTLDPMASGLMVLLIGEATKLSHYILERDKAYIAQVKLGVTTDSLDMTGKVLTEVPVDIPQAKVREAALALTGEMDLPVPLFSAMKVDGTKLYEHAHRGETVETPHKKMHFYDLQILGQGANWVEVSLRCTKGSFIRSWAHLLGQNLGCGGALSKLVRTEALPYRLSEAVTTQELEKHRLEGSLAKVLIPMSQTLPEYPALRVSGLDATLALNGQISHALKSRLISSLKPEQDPGVKILGTLDGKLIAMVGLEPGRGFVLKRVFRY